MTARRWLLLSLAALALLLVVGRFLAAGYAEWTWFASMGALPLYRSRLVHETALRGGAALVAFLFVFANLYAVRRSIVSLVMPRRLANLEIGEAVPGRRLTGLVLAVSVVLAVILALPQDAWTTFALARLGEPFAERDPYLDREFGFYVYWLPFERSLYVWSLVAVLVVSAVVVFLYAITPSLRWERGRLYVSTYVRRHLAVLSGLVLALVGWSYRLDGFSLLAAGSGTTGAFTAFDHRVALPLLTGLSLGAFVAAVVVVWSSWHGYHRVTLFILTLLIVAGPGSRVVLPATARWSSTEAERRAAERPYASTRTQFTRRAFGLDEILDADPRRADAASPEARARGVSSWDPVAIVRTADLRDRGLATVALAWMPSPGGLAALTVQRTSTGTGPWTLALADVTNADERGRPLPYIGDPPRTEVAIPPVLVEPDAPPFAVVADSQGQLAAPAFESWIERLAHAWRLRAPRLLALEPPLPRPRIVVHRDVRERIGALAPFFTVGPTLQAVVRADSLYWVAELFSTSGDYPLAEPVFFAGEERHYVHHAATALVQAQTGRVALVADPDPDPIARSWMRRFPGLFIAPSSLPAALAALLPPLVDWATVQGSALVRTGFAGDTLFPRRLALSDNASPDLAAGAPALSTPRVGPLTWSVGVLDADDRVIGALVARGGEVPHTEWRREARHVRWSHVLDTLLVVARAGKLSAQPRAAERIGRVQLLPTRTGLTFVQSFYRWPADAPPSLAGVVVLEGDRVKSGPTLAEALGVGRAVGVGGSAALRARVTALYEEMSAAMRRGDWTAFGNAFAALGRLLRSAP
ncbi:MAG TPA: UPF0182 family protein [Gemmatimonadaceae bacterium]|nr:UPF0182 family protein [Gemmatimonadaceae bacterium]